MSGFFTQGAIGNTAAEAEGTDLIPSTAGEVLGATFGQTFAENPSSRLFRHFERNSDWQANLPDAPRLTPEEANARFSVPNRLSFTEPVTEAVAANLNRFHRESAVREDIIARRDGGFGTGGVSRFGAGVAASILDPLNIASAFIPGVREGRVAALAGGAARGALGRAGVRVVSGATAGAAGAAALEPLNYWLAQQDRDDYTMGDALMNLAFGAAIGGVLHSGLGAIRDRGGLPAWSPEMHEAALRQSVASLVEGQPVQAAAAMEFTAVRAARQELRDLLATASRFTQDFEQAVTTSTSRASTVLAAREAVERLQQQADDLLADLDQVRGRPQIRDLDDVSQARLNTVLFELQETIPRSRRAELERERDMLLEGRDVAAADVTPLDEARTAAEQLGLERALRRTEGQRNLARARLARAEAELARARSTAAAREASLTAREALIEDLIARTLRKTAGRLGAALPADEAADLAAAIVAARRSGASDAITQALDTISTRAPAGPYLPSEVVALPGETVFARMDAALAQREQAADSALRDVARGADTPFVAAARQNAQALEAAAPVVEGRVADDLAEATTQTQEIANALRAADKAFADAEVAAGRAAPEPDPEIVAADDVAKEGDAMGRAFEAAATCAIGGRRG